MMLTENTLKDSSSVVDIASQEDFDAWKSARPKKANGSKHLSFVCCECKEVKTLMLRSMTAFPIMCKSCRMRHRYDDPQFIEKMRQTNLARYGVAYNSQTKAWKDSLKSTCMQKYGVDHFSKLDSVKDKIRATSVQRYGGVGFASDELRQKQRNTMLEKYDVCHNMQSPVLKQQFFDTLTNKYGGIGNAVEQFAEKYKSTLIDRYGTPVAQHVQQILDKCKKKYKYDNIWFDSIPEIQFYMNLRERGISFEYHPHIHFTYECNNVRHYYYPDFEVDGEYVELKGVHFFGKRYSNEVDLSDPNTHMINPYNRKYDAIAQAKYECMKQNNVKIVLVDKVCNRDSFIKQHGIIVKSKGE